MDSDQMEIIWEGDVIEVPEEEDNRQSNISFILKSIKANSKLSKIERSIEEVQKRFLRGCECEEICCFEDLNPESVYEHRLNIKRLTKYEHDMYLIGITMASLLHPDKIGPHSHKRSLRTHYIFQGRAVCLDAFLYLENCTYCQIKRIRSHVMTHGVTRIAPHGNHNFFSLRIYKEATEFLKRYLKSYADGTGVINMKKVIKLPWNITKKRLYEAYIVYSRNLKPDFKLMRYATFAQFLKQQFSNVKFCRACTSRADHYNEDMQEETQQETQQESQQEPPQEDQQLQKHDLQPQQQQSQDEQLQQEQPQQFQEQLPQLELQLKQTQFQQQQPQYEFQQHQFQQQQVGQYLIQQTQVQILEARAEDVIENSVTLQGEIQQFRPLVVAQGHENAEMQNYQQGAILYPISQMSNNYLINAQNPMNVGFPYRRPYQFTNGGYVIDEHGNILTNVII